VPTLARVGLTIDQLGRLWAEAGGSPERARLAAGVAWAESMGIPEMTGPDGRVGLWQPPVWAEGGGPLMSLAVPLANARAAVEASADGTDWRRFRSCILGIVRPDGTRA
jgi:Lysozyme like domain